MLKYILPCLLLSCFHTSSFAFEQHQGIHYNIIQTGIKVGEASLSFKGKMLYRGQEAIFIEFIADGFNFLDHEKIYLDLKSLKPIAVERSLNIFGQKEEIVETYLAGKVVIVKTSGAKRQEQTIDKAGLIDNIYAFIYRFRASGVFELNKEFAINLPTKDIKIVISKKDKMKVAGKSYDVFFMSSKPSKYKIWFDASSDKLPLKISGAVGIANTSMVMTSYE